MTTDLLCGLSWECKAPASGMEHEAGRLCEEHARAYLAAHPEQRIGAYLSWLELRKMQWLQAEDRRKRERQRERQRQGKVSEKSVLAACQKAAEQLGCYPIRLQSQLSEIAGRTIRTGEVGGPDLLLLVPVQRARATGGAVVLPLLLAVECKSSDGRQSDAQRAWEARWVARGGIYRVVRSAAELWQAVEDLRSLRGLREVAS